MTQCDASRRFQEGRAHAGKGLGMSTNAKSAVSSFSAHIEQQQMPNIVTETISILLYFFWPAERDLCFASGIAVVLQYKHVLLDRSQLMR